MKLERIKNAKRNIFWGVVNRLINIIIPFFIRTLFIYSLGSEYLGLNSLFTSILAVLNIAELGFSNAIIVSMYKPIAENDTPSICALMNLYKKVYRIIGLLVFCFGVALVPFLSYFIKGSIPNDINLKYVYLLYLFNSSVSYLLFSYKSSIIIAFQRHDLSFKINIVFNIIMYFVQLISLLVLHNYYIYVFAIIVNTILINIISALVVLKLFPQYRCYGVINHNQKKMIRKNIEGLVIGKLCLVSRNAFDNIIISFFLGLQTVTVYGNYYLIMNSISGFLSIIMTSIGAGIGNSVAIEPVKKNYEDFMKFTFLYSWLASWCTVCLFCLYQPFMIFWMGDNLLLPSIDVLLLCLYFYLLSMGDVKSQYIAASGLFWENRHVILLESITNIILNFLLGKLFGLHGIILSTCLSIFFLNFVLGSFVLFKYYFTSFNIVRYFVYHIFYMLCLCVVLFFTYYFCVSVTKNSISSLFFRLVICLLFPNLLFYFFYRKLHFYNLSKKFCISCFHIKM